ncbi:MAG: hypothetical protein ACUVTZ_04450 [Armatimonadota bacterium]
MMRHTRWRNAAFVLLIALSGLTAAPASFAKLVPREVIAELGFDKRDMPSDYRIQRDEIGTLQGTRTQIWRTKQTVEVKVNPEDQPKPPFPAPPTRKIMQPLGTITLSVWVEADSNAALARLKKEMDPKTKYRQGGPSGVKIGTRSYIPASGNATSVLFARANVAVKLEGTSPRKTISQSLIGRLARIIDAKIRRLAR